MSRFVRFLGVLVLTAIIVGAVTSGVVNAYYYTAITHINGQLAAALSASPQDGVGDWIERVLGVKQTQQYTRVIIHQRDGLEVQVQSLERDKDHLETRVASLVGELSQEQAKVRQAAVTITDLRYMVSQLEADRNQLAYTISQLEAENWRLREEVRQGQPPFLISHQSR